MEFFLLFGWVWSMNWLIDRNGNVDEEGWFYGFDF